MKKLFIMLALFASASVFASEAVIKETIMAYRKADAQFDVSSMDYLTADFSGSLMGVNIHRKDLEKALEFVKIMQKTNDLEVFLENAFRMQKQELSDDLRQRIRSIKNTEDGKKYLQQGKENLDKLQSVAIQVLNSIVFKSCKISGSNAVVVFEAKDIVSGQMLKCRYTLVKRNGRWFINSMQLPVDK